MKLEERAIDFSLKGTDGKTYSLNSFQSSQALVIIFSCNHCPYVKAYEDRMIALENKYQKRQVSLIAINSNDFQSYPEDSFEEMQRRSQEKKFNFPYLHDFSQKVAQDYEATHTPHLFVFDQNRQLAYTGKIDDNWQDKNAVKEKYLEEALEDILSGKKVRLPQTHAIGCTIKWKK